MRKIFFLPVIAVCICAVSANAQVSYKAGPQKNAKAAMALLTKYTVLSESAFINTAQTLSDYFKEISAIHFDNSITPETAKLQLNQSINSLKENLRTILTEEQMKIWINTVQPETEKQLRDN